jgi:hypothetical protein
MKIDEIVVREAMLFDDEKIIGHISGDVVAMIDQNPFSERIKFLLANQDLAKKPVKNVNGELSAPNCIGTAFFIAGVGPFGYPYYAYDEIRQYLEEPELRNYFSEHSERRVPGAFCFSYSTEIGDWHAGIYLGMVGDEHILFAQHGYGKSFGPESLWNYCVPTYYLPRTLLKSQSNPA